MIEPGDTVVVRWPIRSLRTATTLDPSQGPVTSHWSFCGVVKWVDEHNVCVAGPSIERPGLRADTYFCKASEIVWVAGEESSPSVDSPEPAQVPGSRYLPPGSYGDNKDPRGAMRRLAAEREAITGKPVRVRKTQAGAVAQLDSWMESSSWQELCPPCHYLGRHFGNFLDIGVWPDEDTEVEP